MSHKYQMTTTFEVLSTNNNKAGFVKTRFNLGIMFTIKKL